MAPSTTYPPMDSWQISLMPEIQSQVFWLYPFSLVLLAFPAVRAAVLTLPIIAGWAVGFFIWLRFVRWLANGGRFYEDKLKHSLSGKVVLVTGANSGIGKISALRLAKLGAVVVMGCRDPKRAQDALDYVKRESGNTAVYALSMDLSNLALVAKSAREFLSKYSRLDILLNNAGVMNSPFGHTADGFETQFGTNHMGHFLLTFLLLPTLIRSRGRVVNVSSNGHWLAVGGISEEEINSQNTKDAYTGYRSYGISKAANILHARELNTRFGALGLTSASLHPGAVQTEIFQHASFVEKFVFRLVAPIFLKTPWAGTDTQLKACVDPKLASGDFYLDCHTFPCSRDASSSLNSAWLWEYSLRAVSNFVDAETLAEVRAKHAQAFTMAGQLLPAPAASGSASEAKKDDAARKRK